MQTGCVHCGQQHLLNDELVSKHPKVQFRCTRCGQTTVVEIKRQVDQTMVISPLPSFGKPDPSTITADLPPVDDGLHLPGSLDILLTVTAGPDHGLVFALKTGRTVIGRTGSDFALNDPEISRHHCLLEVRDLFLSLKDLDSTNGTYFDGSRVRTAVLVDGSIFRVGTSTIQIAFQPKPV